VKCKLIPASLLHASTGLQVNSVPFTVRDHARLAALGASISTLEKWRLSGEGPPYLKLNRLVRYRRADIDDWLAARVVRSTSEYRRAK
jgi:predicted DNA-binding transcriptional regulator AlpA